MARKGGRKVKACNVCQRPTEMVMCPHCGDELRHLLIGMRGVHGQPGLAWLAVRIFEQAYGQSRLGAIDSSHGRNDGYALLTDDRCTRLLGEIRATLDDWVAHCGGLSATWRDENGQVAMSGRPGHSEPLESRQARYLAGHIKVLRRHKDSKRLVDSLRRFTDEATRLINRPADVCCGPCTTWFKGPPPNPELKQQCGTMLYAEPDAKTVTCTRCKTRYDVEALRDAMRDKLKDMLFTGSELRRLMETRLNDRIPKATFYKMIGDGRLVPRKLRRANGKSEPLFTYADVVEAREKPVPQPKSKHTKTPERTH